MPVTASERAAAVAWKGPILQLLECSFAIAVLLTLHQPSESHGGLVKAQISGPGSQAF